jgi:hypothetical protein
MLRSATILGLALLLIAIYPAHAAVTRTYAGHISTANYRGIRGYISQQLTTSVSSGAVLAWIGLCSDMCSSPMEWVQIGTFQGHFAAGSSATEVHMYYENRDPCGTYYANDIGKRPTKTYFYLVRYDGNAAKQFTCPNGVPFLGYTFFYKKGSSTSSPFFYGVMSTKGGRADANTEVHNSPPQGVNYFGCSDLSCSDTAYGIELYKSATGWSLWTENATRVAYKPPYLQTFNNYWSLKTCPSAC